MTSTQIYLFTREDTADIEKIGEPSITQQKGFKWTIRVLRQFTNLLSITIQAWETFKNGEIRCFYIPHSDELAESSWGTYLAAIDKDVTHLRRLRSSLQHQTKLFENMTNSLLAHAQHAEAVTTREQSNFIQALTIIAIVSLFPLFFIFKSNSESELFQIKVEVECQIGVVYNV
jgi:hypothetical protein